MKHLELMKQECNHLPNHMHCTVWELRDFKRLIHPVQCMYVIGWLGGPYSQKLWPRSWKCCAKWQAGGSIFKAEVIVFHYTDRLSLSRAITAYHVPLFFEVDWLTSGFVVYPTWTLNWLTCRLTTISKNFNEWEIQIRDKERCIKGHFFIDLLYASFI